MKKEKKESPTKYTEQNICVKCNHLWTYSTHSQSHSVYLCVVSGAIWVIPLDINKCSKFEEKK